MRLDGKRALVTGSARGIGLSIAELLHERGALVYIADIDEGAAKEACQAMGAAGFFKLDVSSKEQVDSVFNKLGGIEILVNNAGINKDAMLHKMSEVEFDSVIAINLKGTFLCTQAAAKLMREAMFGRIINISSASWLGNVGQANYAASKAGVVGLTKTACRELARKNITVNAICPGFIDTAMTRALPPKIWDLMISKVAAGYAGDPIEVARLVAFLASDDAGYINGEVINVGGGMVL